MERELRFKPDGWPQDEPFPVISYAKAEKVVRRIRELIEEMLDDVKDKIRDPFDRF